ncbi:MAG: hypothetical protein ACOXZR_03295 [Bacilli bacterium]|jgi:predicted transcriptional regulator
MINSLLKELGISKVKLAKYLGVSRQMVYNYLELNNLEEWPKDKKMKIFTLFDIDSAEKLKEINVTSDYINRAEDILNKDEFKSLRKDLSTYDMGLMDKKSQQIIIDIVDIMKEDLFDSEKESKDEMVMAYNYLIPFLQVLGDIPELKYVLAYYAKINGFILPEEFVFDEEKQITFEGIMFQAMTLYHNGGASKSKIQEAHKRFVADIEHKKEERLSRTQELNTAKVQALKELGYTEINEVNASEVLEKIAEIQARKSV